MKNILNAFAHVFCLILFTLSWSCSKSLNNDSEKKTSPIDTANLSGELTQNIAGGVSNQSSSDIMLIFGKLEGDQELSDSDLVIVFDFILNGTDEAYSESLGYMLFQYYVGNTMRNKATLDFLSQKPNDYKEMVLAGLVANMGIDISDEDYVYDQFLLDFPMFNNSVASKRAFDVCCSTNLGE